MKKSVQALLIVSSLLAVSAGQVFGQFKTDLVNSEGATAPCTGIGPVGAPLAKKCVGLFEQAGFIRVDDVGITGLTIGTSGKDDGVIVQIDPGSPAAQAGLVVGDLVTAVEGKPVKPTPGMIAEQRTFGKRGEALQMKIRRGSSDLNVNLVRAPQTAPAGPSRRVCRFGQATDRLARPIRSLHGGWTYQFRCHLVLRQPFQAFWFYQNRGAGLDRFRPRPQAR